MVGYLWAATAAAVVSVVTAVIVVMVVTAVIVVMMVGGRWLAVLGDRQRGNVV